jgi:Histidine kinase-, DNA gyrase B-, and HSP90-like ATPase
MTDGYKNSTLWTSAFNASRKHKPAREKIASLISALDSLDKAVADMLEQIPDDCKGLTLHDIKHCHQLWEVASEICGSKYQINPAEGFVLGAAFLIHDAGLTASAYPGGAQAIRNSVFYKDMVAVLRKSSSQPFLNEHGHSLHNTANIEDTALFNVLRLLHADRAEHLLETEYLDPLLKVHFTLLSPGIFVDFGTIIGRVAASHHWDLKKVESTFREPEPPSAAYPEWTLDAFKLACILRVADACAIDERRSRQMPFILQNPSGISRDHWMFQRNLRPAHLPSGSDAMIFRSKVPFTRQHMTAWWVAFDAIGLADKELRTVDLSLKRRANNFGQDSSIQLAAKRVEGSGDPAVLSRFIEVTGWRPVNTAARIDNPAGVIELLGGSGLYGNDHSAPIRELVQNAADAVRARRGQNGYGPDLQDKAGEVSISITKSTHLPEQWSITVSDDGIGMDEEALTGDLLDFGKSLWNSPRLAELFPGLAANPKFRPTGRFGIGFYSAFLLGNDVKVMSQRYTAGIDSRLVLHFEHGLAQRAELRPYNATLDGEWPHGKMTIIHISPIDMFKLHGFVAQSMHVNSYNLITPSWNRDDFWPLLPKALRRLTFCLDVTVVFKYLNTETVRINDISIFSLSNSDFCREFNSVFSGTPGLPSRGGGLLDQEMHKFVKIIGPEDTSLSRGFASNDRNHLKGIAHIGGPTVLGVSAGGIAGVVEAVPKTASRLQIEYKPQPSEFVEWGERQLDLLSKQEVRELVLADMLVSLADRRVNLRKYYFLTDFNADIFFIDELEFNNGGEIFIAASEHNIGKSITSLRNNLPSHTSENFKQSDQFRYVLGCDYGDFSSLYDRAWLVEDNTNAHLIHLTVYWQLRKAIEAGRVTINETHIGEYTIGTYTGPSGGVGRFRDRELKRGSHIKQRGIRLKLLPLGN